MLEVIFTLEVVSMFEVVSEVSVDCWCTMSILIAKFLASEYYQYRTLDM
jgi:hypothetical protein